MVNAVAGRPDWASTLDPDTVAAFEAKGWLKRDTTPEAALAAAGKSYRELEARLGKGVLAPPDPTDAEALANWDGWKKLGVPDSAEGYELAALKLPDGMQEDTDLDAAIRQAAVGLKLAPFQLQGLRQEFADMQGRRYEQNVAQETAAATAMADTLKAELGPARYHTSMENLMQLGREVAGENWPEAINGVASALGSVDAMRLMIKMANTLAVDRLPSGGLLPSAGADRMNEIRRHPGYRDGAHPENKALNDEMLQLLSAQRAAAG